MVSPSKRVRFSAWKRQDNHRRVECHSGGVQGHKAPVQARNSSLVTLIYGNGTTEEEAEELASLLTAKFGSDIEVSVINGGQPVYYFIISVE